MSQRRPSKRMRLAGHFIGLQPGTFDDADTFRRTREQRPPPQAAPIPDSLQLQAYLSHERIGGHSVFTLQPKQSESGWHILYLHGGAYTEELVSPHWLIIEQLMQHTGASVTVPLYPLAPEHTYQDAYRFLERVAGRVMERTPAQRVVWCGDSAGGGLALAFAQFWRDQGQPLPAHLILFAPWLDVSVSNPDVAAIEPQDPMLSRAGLKVAAKWWVGGTDLKSPLLSPLYGDSRGLPPVTIYQGTKDILLPDARKYVQQARQQGAKVELHEFPGAFHVFVGATFTPEAKAVYKDIAHLLGTVGHAYRPNGLVRLISLPPVQVAVYLSERRRQQGAGNSQRQPSRGLLWVAALGILWLLQRKRLRRSA